MSAESAERPAPDQVLVDIADYIHKFTDYSPLAIETARLCLIDTIGCGLEGLRFEHCRRLLGPVVEGTVVPDGEEWSFIRVRNASFAHYDDAHRHQGPWYELPARPDPGCFQHRHHDSMA